MKVLLVDSNVILDIFLDDPNWADRAESALAKYSAYTTLYINPIVYTEVSAGFEKIEELESALHKGGLQLFEIQKEALFMTGKAYLKYKAVKGIERSPLPDFYIGSHAAVLDLGLITRDVTRYRTYFPTIRLICP